MSDFDQNAEKRVKQIFEDAEKISLSPTPYLKTRILAEVRSSELEANGKSWKRWAIVSPVAVAVILLITFLLWTPAFKVSINQHVLVKVEVKQIKDLKVAYAEIELPEGVAFYSDRYPEMNSQRILTLGWSPSPAKSHLPFIIQSSTPGTKTIRVKFFDESRTLVIEKSLKISFKSSA